MIQNEAVAEMPRAALLEVTTGEDSQITVKAPESIEQLSAEDNSQKAGTANKPARQLISAETKLSGSVSPRMCSLDCAEAVLKATPGVYKRYLLALGVPVCVLCCVSLVLERLVNLRCVLSGFSRMHNTRTEMP